MAAIDELLREREALLDSIEDSFKDQLRAVRGQFINNLPVGLDNLRDAQFVFDLLNDSGLSNALQNLGHNSRLSMVARIAEESGIDIGRIDPANLRALRTSNQALLEAHSRVAAERFRATMLAVSLVPAPVPVASIVESVGKAIDGALFSKGGLETQVNTAMAAWDRQLQAEMADQAGTNLWAYFGPSDRLTRPFCRAVLGMGKVFTDSELDELNTHPLLHNYVPPNVKVYCGGYNCRHMFGPVLESWAKQSGFKVPEVSSGEA